MEKFSITLARYAALISIALQLCCTPAAAQVLTIPGQYGINTQMPTNYVKNKGCYSSVRDITASGGSLTRNTTTPLENGADCAIDASASGQTYSFSTYNFDRALAGQNCEARFVYKGDASLYKAYVLVNSVKATADLQLINSSTNPQTVSLNFPCGAQPLTTAVVIESTSASAAAINVAQVYAGLATNIGTASQATVVGTADQAGASSCSFSENTSTGESTYVTLGSAGSCASAWTVTGALTAPAATTSAQTYNNMPAGTYEIIIDAPFFSDTSGVCNFQINDGSNSFGFLQIGNAANATGGPLVGMIQYTNSASRTFSIQAADTHAGSCFALNNVAGRKISWTFKKFPTISEQAFRPETSLAYFYGYHDDTCAWTLTSTTYADYPLDATCNFVARKSAGIVCSANGSVTPSMSCVFPKIGTYQVCAYFSPYGSIATGHAHQLLGGATQIATANEIAQNNPSGVTLCGPFDVTSLSSATIFKIQSQASSGTNVLQTQRAQAFAIEWNITPQTQGINAPILVGGVTSNSSSSERVERFKGTCSTTSSLTSTSVSGATIGNQVSSCCDITLPAAQAFSSTANYSCVASRDSGTAPATFMSSTIFSTTGITVCASSGSSAAFNMTCMGPR